MYVHGYDDEAAGRLGAQAATLAGRLHAGVRYAPGERVLEAGCGVGSQTVLLARNSPQASFLSVEIEPASVAAAQARCGGIKNVTVRQGNILALDLEDDSVDHAFVCFVLEHLEAPERALEELARVVRPHGTVTVIEGDHGSVLMHPESPAARDAIDCQVRLQALAGGDAMIGRRLHPLLAETFEDVRVEPVAIYADQSLPGVAEGFTRATFTDMIAGTRARAIAAGLIAPARFDEGIRGLEAAAAPGGTFFYTFFRGMARVRARSA